MKVNRIITGFLCLLLMGLTACGSGTAPKTDIILATTTSFQDSGLLDVLKERFEKENSGFILKYTAVGSGEAIQMGRNGNADVLVVHSPRDEETFMKDELGKSRQLVMTNTFIVVGPPDDPAGCSGLKSAVESFKQIAAKSATFISRGDQSGTHKKELSFWEKAAIKPAGAWYVAANTGMGEVLQIANQKRAYTLTDRGTYLAFKSKLELKIMVEGDAALVNPYSVIVLNPAKFPKMNMAGAEAWAQFLMNPATQQFIGEFGRKEFGEPLFIPAVK